ncbi:MAG: fimbrillin family protein [Bacteroidales bacterium]|nr:fimbrillin family protein [Bacteroidales bacterium]
MKQIQYSLLALLLILLGCSKDVVKDDGLVIGPLVNEITFSVGSVSDSRATIMDNSNFVADARTIGIYANKHKGNLSNSAFEANVMNNEELVYSNAIWSYSPMQFWSNSQDTLYSFVAYSPYTPFVSSSESGVKIPFNCSLNSEDQVDLLYAIRKDINTPGEPVALDFKHALSKVTFKIGGDIDGDNISRVDIVDVELSGLSSSAVADINAYSDVIEWSNNETKATFSMFSGALTIGAEKKNIGEPMLLIPQPLDDVNVTVMYREYGADDNYILKRASFVLPTDKVNVWRANQSYVYNLNLTLHGVDFTVTVSDFEELVNIPVDIPEGVDMPIKGYFVPENAIEYVIEVDVDGYVDASDLYDVAHLVEGADTNTVVKMAYLDEEGFMAWQDWTVTDGWLGAEGALYWNDENCFACIQPNVDGTFATITCKPEIEVGTTATALLDYGNGVILAINLIVADLPTDPQFIAPVADYEIDIQVVQNGGYTCFSLDGTDVDGRGSYSAPQTYLYPIQDVSIDITNEIESVLGIDEGSLESELLSGNVLTGAYNHINEFVTFGEEISYSNFYFSESGALKDYSSSVCSISGINDVNLYGRCSSKSNANLNEIYPSYIVFMTANGEYEYVVKINQYVVAVPEVISYTVVEEYAIMYDVPYDGNHNNLTSNEYNLSTDMISEIESFIGGEVDLILAQVISENGDVTYENWSYSDGWFDGNGIAFWGEGAKVQMKPLIPYEFSYVTTHPDANIGDVAKIVYQYGCSSTRKAVNIEYIVTIVEPASE